MSHYIVGIDLGTTHTVVAYAPRKGARGGVPAVQLLEIEQLVAPGEVAAFPRVSCNCLGHLPPRLQSLPL